MLRPAIHQVISLPLILMMISHSEYEKMNNDKIIRDCITKALILVKSESKDINNDIPRSNLSLLFNAQQSMSDIETENDVHGV